MPDRFVSRLYPQLPTVLVKKLAQERTQQSPTTLATSSAVEHPDAFYTPTGGTRITDTELSALQGAVRALAQEFGYPENSRRSTAFDAPCAGLLYEEMGVQPAEAAKPGLWAFLACILLPDIVRWRFPGSGGSATAPEHFVGGRRNALGRLWWRAYVLYDPDAGDAYRWVAALGEDELVQLMERPSLAGRTVLAVETCRAFLSATAAGAISSRMALMRDAQKRLMRLSAFTSFEGLDRDAVRQLVERVFEDSRRHLT